jgi:riboflavin kinase/FMN adenylyltransferase
MRVFRDLDSAKRALVQPVLTVGNFDGVHLGHQAIVRETIEIAAAIGHPSAVLTFEPHPQKVLRGRESPPLLTTLRQKLDRLDDLGIESTVVCPFDASIYQYSARQFFSEILVDKLDIVHLVEGEDFTFGRGRTGSPRLLKRLGRDHGVGVTIVAPVLMEGEKVSSTRIRAALLAGDVAKAQVLLGRPYAVEGTRIKGKGRGRTLGYPTVNLVSENELLPPIGIYAVQVEMDQRALLGAASLGFNPTFEGERFSFEVHLLDFSGEVWNQRVRVLFYRRLRDEIRFDYPQDLIHQMAQDVVRVKRIFREGAS